MPLKLTKNEKKTIVSLASFLASCQFAESACPNQETREKLIQMVYNELPEKDKLIINTFESAFDTTKLLLSTESSTAQ